MHCTNVQLLLCCPAYSYHLVVVGPRYKYDRPNQQIQGQYTYVQHSLFFVLPLRVDFVFSFVHNVRPTLRINGQRLETCYIALYVEERVVFIRSEP